MRGSLAAVSILTLLAVAYLSASLIVLRPPRADYSGWFAFASVFAIQGGLTLCVLAAGARAVRYLTSVVLAGGVAIVAFGLWMMCRTLTSPHFEGYALVLGSMLVLQGALTIAAFLRSAETSRPVGR